MEQNFRFTYRQKLHGKKEFARVFNQRWRKRVEVLTIYLCQNELEYNRLGLSVSRKVGGAVKRNKIKRLIREAFRLTQYELPTGYDIVVVVHPHKPRKLEEYKRLLTKAVVACHR